MAKLGFRVLNPASICATLRQMPIRAQKGPIRAQKGPIRAQKGPIIMDPSRTLSDKHEKHMWNTWESAELAKLDIITIIPKRGLIGPKHFRRFLRFSLFF